MACMAASFARGQTRTKASIIRSEPQGGHGISRRRKTGFISRAISAYMAGMVDAVESGTARRAKVIVSLPQRAGTAQFPSKVKNTLAWMIIATEKPEVAMSVV
ncbi:MAG: hypothetical protein ACLUKN_09830 [Bacilli bacterium]